MALEWSKRNCPSCGECFDGPMSTHAGLPWAVQYLPSIDSERICRDIVNTSFWEVRRGQEPDNRGVGGVPSPGSSGHRKEIRRLAGLGLDLGHALPSRRPRGLRAALETTAVEPSRDAARDRRPDHRTS